MRLFTVGHSTRSLEEFIHLLQAHGVQQLVDIRTLPGSKRYPHFNLENLQASLPEAGIEYSHLKGLGGLRKAKADSRNAGWKNASFRGYADYMQTEDFAKNLEILIDLAKSRPTAIMCSEAVPWRCHRSLVADALLARGMEVMHLMSPTQGKPHRLTSFAKVEGTQVNYP